MKKSILVNLFIFCLFGLGMQSGVMAHSSLSGMTNEASFTTPPPCNTPTWLSTTNITQTSAMFNWSAASGAQSYSLQTRIPNGAWNDVPGLFYSTSVTVSGFSPNTTYEWRVRSNCSGGEYSPWSASVTFITLGGSYCNAPSWLGTTNITSTSAMLDWNSASGAMSYSLQWRLAGGTWYDVPGGPWTETWYTLTGLSPGTSYEWRVRSNCSGGQYSAWSYPAAFTTTGGSCETPTWLSTLNITQTTATFDWDAVSGAENYTVQWRLAGGTWYTLSGGPFYNTYVNVGGFSPGTNYEWRVRSNCWGGYSPWSYPEPFTTLGYSCSTPTWPTTSNITSTSATFSWDAVAGAINYTVQYRLPNGTWYEVPGSPVGYTSINLNGLSPGTTYEWRVRANCSGGQYSNWTYPVSFTTVGGTCEAPGWLTTTNITQTTATFDWDPVSGAESYTVQWRLAGGTWYTLSGGPFTNTYVNVGGLQPGTAYEWRVRSNCWGGYSAWSYPAAFTTLGYSCSTPTWPTTSNITSTSATFSWSSVSGAISYTVQYRLPNGTWYEVPGSPVYNNSINISGLTPGTTYEWRVRANCSGGQYSNWTWPVSFTTIGATCEAPSWLNTTNITQTSATLDWDPVYGATSYTVEYRVANGTWYEVPGGPFTQTWVTLTGLQPGTYYQWRVRSNCSNWQYSPWSYPASFSTLGYSCSTPTWPTTSNITSTSATFSWSSVSGATSYTVQYRLPNGTWYDVPGSPVYNNSINISGLSPATTYEWRVRANCGGGQYSNWTYPVTFTTLGISCNAPSWLNTTNITQTSATLDWSPVSGAISYDLQYRLANGTWYDVPGGPWTETWYTLTGLQPGTYYQWRVRSNCSNWQYSSWSYYASFTTLGSSCGVPTWPTTVNVTATTATFSWDAVSGAQSYSVQVRVPNGSWSFVPGSPFTSTIVTVDGFNPNTTYEWRVRANCYGGQYSNWTYPIAFTTSGGSCNAPTWLGTTNITQTTATFDWDPVYGAQNYSIQWRLAGGTWYNLSGGPFNNTWVNVGGLEPCTSYEWRVRSNCSNWQYSSWSYPAGFTTVCGYSCSTPTWPVTSNITSTSAKFSWDEVWGAQSYSVEIRLPNGSWSFLPGGPFYNTWVTATGLSPNTTYEWRVRANCSNGQYSAWTYPVSFTTLGGSYCDAPSWLYTTNITQTTATFDWDPVSGAINYSVQWRLAGGTWYNLSGGPFSNTWVNVGGLSPGTAYEWRVKSNCSGGQMSAWSYPASFTTLGYSCGTPTWPVTYNITQTTATFSWDAVPGAVSYSLQRRQQFGPWLDVPGGPFYVTSVGVTGLQPNTNYEWRVRANCNGGQYSSWTAPVPFTTLGPGPNNFTQVEDTATPDIGEPLDIQADEPENVFADLKDVAARPHVMPNPASDYFTVTYMQSENCKVTGITLNDMSGKRIYMKKYDQLEDIEFSDDIDVSNYEPGVYILQMVTNCGLVAEKVVIAR